MTELPNGWRFSRLDEVATVVRGVTYSSKDVLESKTADAITLLRATNIQNGVLDQLDPVWIPRSLVKPQQVLVPGDVVIASSSGSIQVVGKSAIVKASIDATFGAFCTTVRATNVLPDYLGFYLQDTSLRQKWSELASGSNINNLKTTDIAATLIPVPPLEEQKRIVEALEDHLSRLDKALLEVRDSEERASQFRSAVLEESIFGGGKTQIATLGAHIETRKSKGIPSQDPEAKYLGLEHVEAHLGRVSSFSSARDYKSASSLVEAGDLLYGRLRPYLNKVVIAPEKLYVSAEFIVMKPSASLETTFLKHLLMSPTFLAFTALLDTGDRPRVSWDKISSFEFPLPNHVEQRQIVNRIEEALTRISSMQDDFAHLVKNVGSLRRSVLHAAFSGQL